MGPILIGAMLGSVLELAIRRSCVRQNAGISALWRVQLRVFLVVAFAAVPCSVFAAAPQDGECSCVIDVAYADDRPAGLPVSLGVPFPKGMLTDPSVVSVVAPGGERRPAGCRPFVFWSDGSVRWAVVTFGARERGAHQIKLDGEAAMPPEPVTLSHAGDTWTIDNGRLAIVLGESGPGIIKRIRCDGHTYLDDPSKLRFCVDYASTNHESGRTIRVLEQSPLRVRLRVEGAHFTSAGDRKLSYRLDVELWTGWTTLRLDYHFFNLMPGQPAVNVDRLALDVDWSLPRQTERHFLQTKYGSYSVSRHVFSPDNVAIVADERRGRAYVEDPAMLLDDVDYPFYLHPPLVDTADRLGVSPRDARSIRDPRRKRNDRASALACRGASFQQTSETRSNEKTAPRTTALPVRIDKALPPACVS